MWGGHFPFSFERHSGPTSNKELRGFLSMHFNGVKMKILEFLQLKVHHELTERLVHLHLGCLEDIQGGTWVVSGPSVEGGSSLPRIETRV